VVISLISCFILFIWGVFTLVIGDFNSTFVPSLLSISGFIGFTDGVVEIKKDAA
jgi:hypothetical protein